MRNILGIDFGGTNLRMGWVDSDTGNLNTPYVRPIKDITSNSALLALITEFLPNTPQDIGISAAGNVDEKARIILNSPNSGIKGQITFPSELRKLGHRVHVTNDVRAASLAAALFGEGKGYENVLLATYSSGFNCAVVRNGQPATTAEFGHMPYLRSSSLGDLLCGCGGKNHLESFVSGNGAAQIANKYFRNRPVESKAPSLIQVPSDTIQADSVEIDIATGMPKITAQIVYAAFRQNPHLQPYKGIQELQVLSIADSFGMMVSAYNPIDLIVLMGSQTKDWDVLFNPAIQKYKAGGSQPGLKFPEIVRTQLPEIGVQGAAAYFLSREKN